MPDHAFVRRLAWLLVALVALTLAGTAGFVLTTDRGGWDSLVLTLDTIATVGSIPQPEETSAQIVKVVLIVTGVGALFYAVVTVTEFFVAGQAVEMLARRRMQRMIDDLSDHFIICGFGRVGRQVARDLQATGTRHVVIDINPEVAGAAAEMGARFIEGDPGEDHVLRLAGIDRARGVIACVDSDAENIFITLTARDLREDIAIVARAAAEESERKLLRAGATRVISPYKSSGAEMARYALHPQVSGVLEVAPEYRMEEITVSPGCAAAGRTIGEVRGGALIVAVKRGGGPFQTQPALDMRLEPGDVVMAMGSDAPMDELEARFDAPAGVTG